MILRIPGPRKPASLINHGFRFRQFWDAEPIDFPTYYAPQRECQNAALLQMIQTAVEQAAAASSSNLGQRQADNLGRRGRQSRRLFRRGTSEAAVASRSRFGAGPRPLPNIDHATYEEMLRLADYPWQGSLGTTLVTPTAPG